MLCCLDGLSGLTSLFRMLLSLSAGKAAAVRPLFARAGPVLSRPKYGCVPETGLPHNSRKPHRVLGTLSVLHAFHEPGCATAHSLPHDTHSLQVPAVAGADHGLRAVSRRGPQPAVLQREGPGAAAVQGVVQGARGQVQQQVVRCQHGGAVLVRLRVAGVGGQAPAPPDVAHELAQAAAQRQRGLADLRAPASSLGRACRCCTAAWQIKPGPVHPENFSCKSSTKRARVAEPPALLPREATVSKGLQALSGPCAQHRVAARPTGRVLQADSRRASGASAGGEVGSTTSGRSLRPVPKLKASSSRPPRLGRGPSQDARSLDARSGLGSAVETALSGREPVLAEGPRSGRAR